MTPSHNALALIEAFEHCVLTAYADAGGVPTIGWGTTNGIGGFHFNIGTRISWTKADELLTVAVDEAAVAIGKHVTVPLRQCEFDALTSFAYNVGTGALSTSTLLRRLNAGDRRGAAAQFGQWVHAGGRVLNGLVVRRHVEATLFAGDVINALHLAAEHGGVKPEGMVA